MDIQSDAFEKSEATSNIKDIGLKDLTHSELCDYFSDIGEKKFRVNQLWKRMYQDCVQDMDSVTEFSEKLRAELNRKARISSVEMLQKQVSTDGTRKYLFDIRDGYAIESVFMKYKYGNTACISSQAGCRMGCSFCASGIFGLQRNLTPGEMVDQIVAMQRDTGERIGHVVVMGTGEPFDNYDNLLKAIKIMHDEKGLNIGLRNITVSTCGILNKIRSFTDDLPQVNLAISLHAPTRELRCKLMPIAHSYEMSELLETCKYYMKSTHRRITFEYALIKDVNDTTEHAEQLSTLLKGMLCHVNLIPLNSVKEKNSQGTDKKFVKRFATILERQGIDVTVRREMGSDISAACGQLRLSAMSECNEA